MEHGKTPGETQHNGPLPPDVQDQITRIREDLAEFDQRARSLIQEHPVASVLGAVAVGYVVGRLLSRW